MRLNLAAPAVLGSGTILCRRCFKKQHSQCSGLPGVVNRESSRKAHFHRIPNPEALGIGTRIPGAPEETKEPEGRANLSPPGTEQPAHDLPCRVTTDLPQNGRGLPGEHFLLLRAGLLGALRLSLASASLALGLFGSLAFGFGGLCGLLLFECRLLGLECSSLGRKRIVGGRLGRLNRIPNRERPRPLARHLSRRAKVTGGADRAELKGMVAGVGAA